MAGFVGVGVVGGVDGGFAGSETGGGFGFEQNVEFARVCIDYRTDEFSYRLGVEIGFADLAADGVIGEIDRGGWIDAGLVQGDRARPGAALLADEIDQIVADGDRDQAHRFNSTEMAGWEIAGIDIRRIHHSGIDARRRTKK